MKTNEKRRNTINDLAKPRLLVCDYMTQSPHTIGIDQTVARARVTMVQAGIRHLPVLDDGHLVGMVSERDLRLVPDEEQSKVTLDEVMSADIYAVDGAQLLADVARHMADHRLGSAVVTSNGHVIGIIAATDLSKALADVLQAA